MLKYLKKNKNKILNLSLKKIYSHFFLNEVKSNSYYAYLKNLVFEFLKSKYPNYQKETFEKKLDGIIAQVADYKDITTSLNLLFNPSFNDDMQFHYKYSENRMFLAFIKYSINIKLIRENYSKIYNFSISKLSEPLDILEIGGGLPHGFIYNNWKKENNYFNSFNYVEADLLHSEFVSWYCKKNKFEYKINLFPAAKAPNVDNIKFNFVFAKDVFEHLDKPDLLLQNLVSNVNNPKTLLCLDLEPKSPHNVQHLSPNLPILKKILTDNNFNMIEKFGDIGVWQKE
tara:strand:+ start:214 stop:1068 length:855 start_codon:yes stop_codon:yes gene_type:complete